VLRRQFSGSRKFCAPKSATAPSAKPLTAIFPQHSMKVYLDNNIFIYIENQTLKLSDIEKLIPRPIDKIFYSASHIQETLEIKGENESQRLERIKLRLKTISEVTKNTYINENLQNEVYEYIESPFEVIKTITEVPTQSIMKSFMNIVSEEQKKELRKLMKIDSSQLNHYEPEKVIEHLSNKLIEFGGHSFLDMIEVGISYHKDGHTFGLSNRIAGIFELLDMLGYWKDKATDKSNYARLWDSSHTFYSSFCDYFISSDKRTINKAKLIFNLYKIKTEVLSPQL